MEGGDWTAVLHPDDLANCVTVWTHAVKTGIPYKDEYRFKRDSDGAYRWHVGRGMPLRDANGSII
jgi:hypothetical protein